MVQRFGSSSNSNCHEHDWEGVRFHVYILGVGNSNMLQYYFHPDPWGFMIQFDSRIFFRLFGSTTNQKKSWIQNSWGFYHLMAVGKITSCCLHSANFHEWPNFSKWLGSSTLKYGSYPSGPNRLMTQVWDQQISLSASYIWCLIIHLCIQLHWSSWFFRCVPCTFQI